MSLLDAARSKINAAKKALTSASSSVAGIRDEIARLQAERRAIETAPLPADEAAPVMHLAADRLLSGVRPQTADVDEFVEAAALGRPLDIRLMRPEAQAGLLLSVLEPVIRAQLEARLSSFYGENRAGLPAAARQARLREIDAELLSLEREEENLLAELAGAGLVLDRRPDADPRVFFEETAGA